VVISILVSLIIPVYNSEPYLERFFKGIALLSITDYELVFVDDGSTDKSLDFLSSFCETLNCSFKIISKNNEGQSSARNTGFDNATGDFVCFLDSDDLISQYYFSIFDLANNIYEYDMFIGNFQKIKSNYHSTKDKLQYRYLKIESHSQKKLFLNKFLTKNIKIHNSAIIYNKKFLNENKIIFKEDIRFGEDSIFIWTSLLLAKKILFSKQVIYYYFNNPNSVMKSSATQRVDHFLTTLKEYFLNFKFDKNIFDVNDIYPNYLVSTIKSLAKKLTIEDYINFVQSSEIKSLKIKHFTGLRFKFIHFLIKFDIKFSYWIISVL
jgi:glycosyltransferase involved in cell wall biosynthesis